MHCTDLPRSLFRPLAFMATACLLGLLAAGAALSVGLTSPVGYAELRHGSSYTITPQGGKAQVWHKKEYLLPGDTLATAGRNEVVVTLNYKGGAKPSCDTGAGSAILQVVPPSGQGERPPVLVKFVHGSFSCSTPKGLSNTPFSGGGTTLTAKDPSFVFTVDAKKKAVTIKLRKGAAVVRGAHGPAVVLALNPTKHQSSGLAKQVVIPFDGVARQPKKATLSAPEQTSLKAVNGLAATQSAPSKLPTATVKGPPKWTARQDSTFAFSGGSLYACSFDGGGYYACANPLCRMLVPGPHTLSVLATDVAGNTQNQTAPTKYTWTVKKSPAPPIVYQSNSNDPTEYQIYKIGLQGGAPTQLTGLNSRTNKASILLRRRTEPRSSSRATEVPKTAPNSTR